MSKKLLKFSFLIEILAKDGNLSRNIEFLKYICLESVNHLSIEALVDGFVKNKIK